MQKKTDEKIGSHAGVLTAHKSNLVLEEVKQLILRRFLFKHTFMFLKKSWSPWLQYKIFQWIVATELNTYLNFVKELNFVKHTTLWLGNLTNKWHKKKRSVWLLAVKKISATKFGINLTAATSVRTYCSRKLLSCFKQNSWK